MDNKGKAAWIDRLDLFVAVKAICRKINISQTCRNIYLATPNPRASSIYYIVCVVSTFGQAADGKRFTVGNTIEVCVSVTANLKAIATLVALDIQNIQIMRKKKELQRLELQQLTSSKRCRIED